MIIKRKLFGWFGFGKEKEIISGKELLKEYKFSTDIDPEITKYFKIWFPNNSSVDKGIWEYLTVLKNKFPTSASFTGKDDETIFGYDEVIKHVKRYKNNFGGVPLIPLWKVENGIYGCYWSRIGKIWFFNIRWGGYSQGMFGLDCPPRKTIEITLG